MKTMKQSQASAKYCKCHMLGKGKKIMDDEAEGWMSDLVEKVAPSVINLGSKALSKYVPENLSKTALTGLKDLAVKKMKGGKKPQSAKQKAYQQTLQDIRDKYGLSFKDALIKYKEMKK